MPRFLIICLHVLILMATAILPARIALASDDSVAPNLYRVSVLSHRDAEILAELDVNAIHRVRDGYLVLAPEGTEIAFTRAGIDWIRVATAVDCNRLALDISHDPALRAECPVIFEEPGTRIYLVDSPDVISSQRGRSLAPIRIRNLPITYPSPPAFNKSAAIPSGALDSLVNGISQDSLVAYSDHLESYNGRVAGTSGGLMSALWSANKFSEYGCDSVVIDTFTETLDGEPKLCRNVLAYKIGLEFPHHHIIIGAHRDTEPGCPGADDNGSGTAAVLEVARSMADIETRTTVVFALFDAEEYGLLGAWHYAQRAFEHDEKIPFMLNMDMIAHFENTDQAHLYCEDRDSAYARVWADMADSIPTINLTGHLSGWFGSSDHVPFQDYGYPALFVHEYIRSTVYHTSRDSTVYLNYDYFTRMTKASGATAYVVDQQFVPEYDIQVYPVGDYPNLVYPGVSTPISIGIHTFGGAEILPGDVHLVYSVNDGEEQSVSMSPIGDDAYTADLPQLSCLDNIAYRIRIEEDSLGIFYYPFAGAFIRAFSATDILYLFNEDFSEDLGWTVTGDAVAAGQWMLSDNIESGIWGAPDGDFDGNGFCYVTGKTPGSDVDYGTSILTSPAVDVTASTCLLEYARWYSNDYGGLSDGEVFNIDLSTDNGVTWLPIDSAGPVDQASGGWNLISFRLEDLISLPADVQLRFTARDIGDDSQIEAAVDAVKFIVFDESVSIVTDLVPTWTAGHLMSFQLQAAVCEGGLVWTDRYGQLNGTGLELSTDGLLTGIPQTSGSKLFTAQVFADDGSSAERKYIFYINPALTIGSTGIPSAEFGEPYSAVLSANGGTGNKTWTDRDGDLIGSGITLSSDGMLTGVPVEPIDIPFVAQVTDQVGASADKTFTLHITGPYVCGDASGDGSISVGDAVWIINYVFSGGPAPDPIESGDANADGVVSVADAVNIINYVFKGGPEPRCP